jgi:ankyrin repeat protein
LQILLQRGADVGLQNDRGETPLIEAMESGAMFAAELLLREACSPPLLPHPRCLSVVAEETSNRNSLEQPMTQKEQPDQTKIESDCDNSKQLSEQPKVNGEQPKINGEHEEQIRNKIDNLKINSCNINASEQPKIVGEQLKKITNGEQLSEQRRQPAIWLMRSTLYGETALHVAARKDLISLVELILQANHEPEVIL